MNLTPEMIESANYIEEPDHGMRSSWDLGGAWVLSPCCHCESRYVDGEDVESPPDRGAAKLIRGTPEYKRRRECAACGRRFNTLEQVSHMGTPPAGRGQLLLFGTW